MGDGLRFALSQPADPGPGGRERLLGGQGVTSPEHKSRPRSKSRGSKLSGKSKLKETGLYAFAKGWSR